MSSASPSITVQSLHDDSQTLDIDLELYDSPEDITEQIVEAFASEDQDEDWDPQQGVDYRIIETCDLGEVYDKAIENKKDVDLDELCELAKGVSEHGTIFAEWFDHVGGDPDRKQFQEQYQGAYRSVEDYARQLCDDLGYIDKDVPALISNNIDWKGVASDLESGDIFAIEHDGETHVFDNT